MNQLLNVPKAKVKTSPQFCDCLNAKADANKNTTRAGAGSQGKSNECFSELVS